jgi:hypothetical protein
MARLAPIDNLELFNVKPVPSWLKMASNDGNSVIHQSESCSIVGLEGVTDLDVDVVKILPITHVVVEDAFRDLSIVVAQYRQRLLRRNEADVRFLDASNLRNDGSCNEVKVPRDGIFCLPIELLNAISADRKQIDGAKQIRGFQICFDSRFTRN